MRNDPSTSLRTARAKSRARFTPKPAAAFYWRNQMQINRRRFVTGLSAPLILGAQDKSGAKSGARPPVLGQGDQKYEWIDNWGQLPSHIKWGKTHNVVEDTQTNIYVHHTVYADSESKDSVVVFDAKGKFIRSWG